jgi:hypothetical protein
MLRYLFLACLGLELAAADGWMEDLPAAQERAQREGRDLFIDFTGSDWCSWCIRLDREIFGRPEFLTAVREHFVLVKLDYLRKRPLPADRQAALDAISERYAIAGFPTVLLCTADGTAYARTGYLKLTPAAYADRLLAAQAARGREPELARQVADSRGPAQAAALHALIDHRDLMGSEITRDLMQQAVAADPMGTLPATVTMRQRLAEMTITETLRAADTQKDDTQRERLISQGLADSMLSAEFRQGLLMRRAMGKFQTDRAGARTDLDAAKALAPNSTAVEQIDLLLRVLMRP